MLKGSRSKSTSSGFAKCENLHLFCSGIECNITGGKYNGPSAFYMDNNPSPYISFVSTPSNAMKKGTHKKKGWKRLFCKLKINKDPFADREGTRLEKGWPRTPTAKNTHKATWNEEVNFKIRTHDNTGTPVDLTGALLHVLVHDERDNSLIGSCTLNLAFLVTVSKAKKEQQDKDATEESQTSSAAHSSKNIAMAFAARLMGKLDASKGKSSNASSPMSVSDSQSEGQNVTAGTIKSALQHRSVSKVIHEQDIPPAKPLSRWNGSNNNSNGLQGSRNVSNGRVGSPDSSNNVTSARSDWMNASFEFANSRPSDAVVSAFDSLKGETGVTKLDDLDIGCLIVDEAVTKNGREVGRIKFTIDTWWLNDEVLAEGGNIRNRREKPAKRAGIGS